MKWIWIGLAVLLFFTPYLFSRLMFSFAMDRDAKHNLARFFDYDTEKELPAFKKAAVPFNEKREEVALDEQHHASFVPANSHDYVILCHGYGNDLPDGMCSYALPYMERNWNILAPYAPSHHKSEGRYITMGWPERKIMVRWTEWLRQKDPDAKIVIHGVSMGGATALNTAGENPAGLVAAIGDCAYTSVWDEFASAGKMMFRLPSFPVLHISSRISHRILGFTFKEASTTDQLAKTNVPVLLFHGKKDTFVPYWMMDVNYQAVRGMKKQVSVEDARHANCVYKYPDYWKDVFDFIEEAKKETNKDK